MVSAQNPNGQKKESNIAIVWLTLWQFNITMEHHIKSPFFMGKSTISMAMFNSFLSVYRRDPDDLVSVIESTRAGCGNYLPQELWLNRRELPSGKLTKSY
jgi:hypothetical protein